MPGGSPPSESTLPVVSDLGPSGAAKPDIELGQRELGQRQLGQRELGWVRWARATLREPEISCPDLATLEGTVALWKTANHPFPHGQVADPSATATSVITALLAQYDVEPGLEVHVAGCHLENRPWLATGHYRAPGIAIQLFDAGGNAIPEDRVDQLRLTDWLPMTQALSDQEKAELESYLHQARRERKEDESWPNLGCIVVWCKWVQGRIVFASKAGDLEVDFCGWASDLANRRQAAPLVACRETGQKDYRVCRLEDGTVTVSSAILECQATGLRTLKTRLKPCQSTGKVVQTSLLVKCPVTGESLLTEAMQACSQCGQRTSGSGIRHGRCLACASLEPWLLGQRRIDAWVARTGMDLGLVSQRAWSGSQVGDRVVVMCRGWGWQRLWVFSLDGTRLGEREKRGWRGEWISLKVG
jgi:hypothetical protein